MLRTLSIAGLLIAIGACSGTDFSGQAQKKTRSATQKTSADQANAGKSANDTVDSNGNGKNGDNSSDADANASTPLGGAVDGANGPGGGGAGANGMLGTAGNSAILTDSGTLIACPKKNQTILILDFKSGWWAGDGGNFFQKITNSLQGTCTQQVTIEYHHIVTDGGGGGLFFPQLNGIQNTMLVVPGGTPTDGGSDFNTAFRDATFASYTQIWVLSGSSADPMDLQPTDPFFQQVLQHAQASKAAFFIGVGYGSISHGNAFASALSVPANFSTQQAEGDILDPGSGVGIATILGSAQMKNHVLFTNGVNNLPDDMVVGGKNAHGDAINATGSVTVIATDNHGQASIAVPDPAASGRKVVLDADLPRYYSIWQDESPDALKFLKNVIVYLSN